MEQVWRIDTETINARLLTRDDRGMVLRGRHRIAIRVFMAYIWQSVTVAQRSSLNVSISLMEKFRYV